VDTPGLVMQSFATDVQGLVRVFLTSPSDFLAPVVVPFPVDQRGQAYGKCTSPDWMEKGKSRAWCATFAARLSMRLAKAGYWDNHSDHQTRLGRIGWGKFVVAGRWSQTRWPQPEVEFAR
jgi:hypothetical protein